MKKVLEWVIFVAIIVVLPGGVLLAVKKIVERVKPSFLAGLLAFVMFSAGCARLQYQTRQTRVSGFTTSPEAAMVMSAEAEERSAQAYAMRRCADDPRKCRAAELSQMNGLWGAGMMDTPAGYTWAGVRAAGVGNSPTTGSASESGDVRKDIADIKKKVNAIDKGQDAFFQTLKKGKR